MAFSGVHDVKAELACCFQDVLHLRNDLPDAFKDLVVATLQLAITSALQEVSLHVDDEKCGGFRTELVCVRACRWEPHDGIHGE